MCEPSVISGGIANRQRFAGTGLSVAEHQRRTVLNLVQLRELGPDLPIIPTVQGFQRDEYLRCVDLYWALARIDLTAEPIVAVGSICRRQSTNDAGDILTALHHAGLTRLDGFGFKLEGLRDHGHLLSSADSLAWSFQARIEQLRLDGCGSPRPLQQLPRLRRQVVRTRRGHLHRQPPPTPNQQGDHAPKPST